MLCLDLVGLSPVHVKSSVIESARIKENKEKRSRAGNKDTRSHMEYDGDNTTGPCTVEESLW